MDYDAWKLESPEDEIGRVRGLYAVMDDEREDDDDDAAVDGLNWAEDDDYDPFACCECGKPHDTCSCDDGLEVDDA